MDCQTFLTPQIKAEIVKHMDEEHPREACGIIITSGEGYEYERLKNTARDKENSFSMSKESSRRVSMDDSIVAVVHTHTKGQLSPSKADMKSQIAVNKPFVIGVRNPTNGVAGVFSFGDHMLDYPLNNRPWHYGVFDCLEAIRSWHHQVTGIYIPRAPRTDFWWDPDRQHEVEDEDKDIYAKSIEPYGFQEYHPNFENPAHEFHPQIGDVIFMQYNSPFVNHTAVYIGNNKVYHHRQGRPSGTNPLGYFMDAHVIRKWTRARSLMR